MRLTSTWPRASGQTPSNQNQAKCNKTIFLRIVLLFYHWLFFPALSFSLPANPVYTVCRSPLVALPLRLGSIHRMKLLIVLLLVNLCPNPGAGSTEVAQDLSLQLLDRRSTQRSAADNCADGLSESCCALHRCLYRFAQRD